MSNFDIKNMMGTPLAVLLLFIALVLGLFGVSFMFKGSVQI